MRSAYALLPFESLRLPSQAGVRLAQHEDYFALVLEALSRLAIATIE
jgi:hypothetical protein